MELIMKKNRYLPLSLIAAAILAGCGTVPPQNTTLAEAHTLYSRAQTNPEVVNLAPVELKKAGESLGKADAALSKGESDATVNHLAYLAKQQVAIAEETAKQKAAELEITNASAQRDQIRLAARTAEVEAARRQAEMAQQTAEEQAARDEALIAAGQAEAEAARRQAESAQQTAEQQAARDQALIAQQEMQLKELEAKKTDRGLVITLGDVLFSVNKAELSPGGTRNVRKLADFLNQYPQRKVLIEGHTDSTGSHSINQPLSERRADAVRTALIDMGVSSDRIETRGYADAYPVANNRTPAGRQLNRRVEIILSDDSGNIVPR
jgi:outer membrane protein OmpA-like peptidoglycan-associated protein